MRPIALLLVGVVALAGVVASMAPLGPETGRMLSTYIVETGQPLATFVDQPVQM